MTDIILTLSQPVLGPWLGSDKYKSLRHWFDSTRVRTHDFEFSPISLNVKWMLNSFGHAIWSFQWVLAIVECMVWPSGIIVSFCTLVLTCSSCRSLMRPRGSWLDRVERSREVTQYTCRPKQLPITLVYN